MSEQAIELSQGGKSKHKDELCPFCQCELIHPKLNAMTIEQVLELQQELINNALEKKKFSDEFLDIVTFPACKGTHAFHKNCVNDHFQNMKKDDKLVKFY